MKQFEIYEADLSPVIGSEQGGIRPVIILQHVFNGMDRILCALLTKKELNTDNHIKIDTQDGEDVYIIYEQARNIDRGRLVKEMGELSERESQKVKDKFFELIK